MAIRNGWVEVTRGGAISNALAEIAKNLQPSEYRFLTDERLSLINTLALKARSASDSDLDYIESNISKIGSMSCRTLERLIRKVTHSLL